jgi:solute carrier family 10 (sodium/bile acid cotransporter), member 2
MLTPFESTLLALLLVSLMFGMGATLRREHFVEVVRRPRAFLIGTASQFGWMPLLAFLLAKGLDLPPLAAIGLIVMGACPGGATSNLFAHLARADVALSVSMTAASKLIGVVMMPVCLYLYARPFTSATLVIPYGEIAKTLVVLLLPVVLAMVLAQRFGPRFAARAERVGSLSGLLVLAILVGVSLVRNAGVFATISPRMYGAALALGALGMLLGDLAARLARLPRAQRRTVSFETGIQNSPLCFAILLTAFAGETQSELLKLPMLYALFILLEASVVTLYYRLSDARTPAPAALPSAGV